MIEKVSFLVHVICSCRYWTKLSTKSLSGEQEFYFGVLKAFTDQLAARKYFSSTSGNNWNKFLESIIKSDAQWRLLNSPEPGEL